MLKKILSKMPGLIWLLWVCPLVALDQFSKLWILKNYVQGQSEPILPGLNFTLAHNHGVAFSLFSRSQGITRILLFSFILAIVIGLIIWLINIKKKDWVTAIPIILITSGAIGNAYDRLAYGYVIDFVDAYFKHWHWYIFNIADCYITLGAIWIIKEMIWPTKVKK